MRTLLLALLFVSCYGRAAAQHKMPTDSSATSTGQLTLYFYNSDTLETVWVTLAGTSATVPPQRLVRAGSVSLIPREGGYTLRLPYGKGWVRVASEKVAAGTSYFSQSGDYVGVIQYDGRATHMYSLAVRRYDRAKDGPLPK